MLRIVDVRDSHPHMIQIDAPARPLSQLRRQEKDRVRAGVGTGTPSVRVRPRHAARDFRNVNPLLAPRARRTMRNRPGATANHTIDVKEEGVVHFSL